VQKSVPFGHTDDMRISVLLLGNGLAVRPKVVETVLNGCSSGLGLREDSGIFE